MKTIGLRRSALVLGAALLFPLSAQASFHFMKIEQAIGGVGGDTSQQAIQLRMRMSGQNQLGTFATRLKARDATGANPVTLMIFPTNPPNSLLGERILIVSPAFAAAHPTIVGDFTMTALIPATYLAGGRLTFEDNAGTIYWSLSWGGYTGSNIGSMTNDLDGNFGPPFGGPLPSGTNQALLFQADPTGSALSTSNSLNYAVTAGNATFTNNARVSTVLPVELLRFSAE